MKKILVCGVVMIFIGGACFIADMIGTMKVGSAVHFNGKSYYLLETTHTLGETVEYKGNDFRVLGIEITKGETRYLISRGTEAMSVVARDCK